MAEKYIKLFEEFPPVAKEDWMNKIQADLKGMDFNRKLVWKTNEGFSVQPFYRLEDLKDLKTTDVLPGEFPYVRGTKIQNNEWYVRQDVFVKDKLKEANEKALNALNKGANSIGFVFEECESISSEDMAVLLKDICLEAAEINFVSRSHTSLIAEAFMNYVSAGKWNPGEIRGSVTCDPFGNYLLFGRMKNGRDAAVTVSKALIEKSAIFPNFRVLAVNGKNYGNAGATVVQELAFSLAQGAEYLSALTDADEKVDDVAGNIKFNLSIGSSYFLEIAKLRAGRMLWANIVKAYGPECGCSCKMIVHAETSRWNKTFYDPYVNMLRTQTETMSGALGGADSITVLPYNAVFEEPTLFSDRIARNQQLLLKEESHFNKVVDPGAGSYYVEELTESITNEVWKVFLEIQDKGGFLAAAKEGFIQSELKKIVAKRDLNVATRRENFVGINQFPNFNERLEKPELVEKAMNPESFRADDAEIDTIELYRGAQAFERLRAATDTYADKNKRPLAFMLTIGNLNFRKARAQFACNFFAVAGYEVKDNNGFETVEEGVAAAKKAGAEIVVVCSSDDEYATLAPAVLEQAKNAIVVIAGAPACMDELKAKGVEHFVHVKSNLLEELKIYQTKLGIN